MSSAPETYTPKVSPVKYWKEYERVLHCCGKVAYYDRSHDGIERGSPTLTRVAKEYDHDSHYYSAKVKKWVKRRDEALHIFNKSIIALGQPYLTVRTGRELLYFLTFNPDYRACCYDTLRYGQKKGKILSLEEIDARYDRRLKKRSERD